MTSEERAAKAFAKAARDVTFNPNVFAYHMKQEAPEAQEKLIIASLSLTEIICQIMKNGATHTSYATAWFVGKCMGYRD